MKDWREILEKEKDNIKDIIYMGSRLDVERIGEISDIVEIWVRDMRVSYDQQGRPISSPTNESRKRYLLAEHISLISTNTTEIISSDNMILTN